MIRHSTLSLEMTYMHVNVRDNQVRLLLPIQGDPLSSVGRLPHPMPSALEHDSKQSTNGWLVVYDENRSHTLSSNSTGHLSPSRTNRLRVGDPTIQ